MEKPIAFTNEGARLYGILHTPDPPAPPTAAAAASVAVLFLNGWTGYRIGPNEIFVETARRLAARGYACLRFDFRGRGDSEGETAEASIQSMIADARAAINVLCREAGVERVVLHGICSGTKVALGAAAGQPTVAGLVLWSAEPIHRPRSVGDDVRKTRFFLGAYWRKLGRAATWKKALAGQLRPRAILAVLFGHFRQPPAAPDENKPLEATLDAFPGPVLLVSGDRDPDADAALEGYERQCRQRGIDHEIHRIADADHSFYAIPWKQQVVRITETWLRRHYDH